MTQPAQIQAPASYQPNEDLIRLRRRVGDLLRLGGLTPETFQQTIMQLWQESEKRRQTALQEAEEHQRKYHACLSQAGAFAAQSSIMYAVINGFVVLEERRLQETAQRALEQAEKETSQKALQEAEAQRVIQESEAAKPQEPKKAEITVATTTTGQPAQEAAVAPKAKLSGGKRKKL